VTDLLTYLPRRGRSRRRPIEISGRAAAAVRSRRRPRRAGRVPTGVGRAAASVCWSQDRRTTARTSTTIPTGSSAGRACSRSPTASRSSAPTAGRARTQCQSADVVLVYSANPAWSGAAAATARARGGARRLPRARRRARAAPLRGERPRRGARARAADRARVARTARRASATARSTSRSRRRRPRTRSPLGLAQLPLHFVDETYWNLEGDPAGISVLATSLEEGRPRAAALDARRSAAAASSSRSSATTAGRSTIRSSACSSCAAIAWCARQPSEGLAGLATIGARLDGE
jgi:hypothetical protein